jgi:hypothetical protein
METVLGGKSELVSMHGCIVVEIGVIEWKQQQQQQQQ